MGRAGDPTGGINCHPNPSAAVGGGGLVGGILPGPTPFGWSSGVGIGNSSFGTPLTVGIGSSRRSCFVGGVVEGRKTNNVVRRYRKTGTEQSHDVGLVTCRGDFGKEAVDTHGS